MYKLLLITLFLGALSTAALAQGGPPEHNPSFIITPGGVISLPTDKAPSVVPPKRIAN